MLFTALLCLSGIGVAAAEPHKNQIVVEATCSNSQSYTFVINGMSKTGQVTDSTDVTVSNNVNVVVKQFTVTYFDETGNPEVWKRRVGATRRHSPPMRKKSS